MKKDITTQHIQFPNQMIDLAMLFNSLQEFGITAPITQHYLIREDKRIIKMPYDKIYYIESVRSNTKFICHDDKLPYGIYQNNEPIHRVYEQLDQDHFFRCHKCYIANLNKITSCVNDGRGAFVLFDSRKKVTDALADKIPEIYCSEPNKRQLFDKWMRCLGNTKLY